MTSNDAKLIAGPAISRATAAPAGAPAARNDTARSSRAPAMFRGNIRNENARAAGFKEGAASVNANDGPRRWLRRYTAGNIGATQQEHNIKGAPAAAAANCGFTSPLPNSLAN